MVSHCLEIGERKYKQFQIEISHIRAKFDDLAGCLMDEQGAQPELAQNHLSALKYLVEELQDLESRLSRFHTAFKAVGCSRFEPPGLTFLALFKEVSTLSALILWLVAFGQLRRSQDCRSFLPNF